jgi:hypothetical protein
MKHKFLVTGVLSALLLLCGIAAAHADLINFTVSLTGPEEVPPNTSPAAGGGIATYDTTADLISSSIFFTGLTSPAVDSHIHLGGPGVAGPILVPFTSVTPASIEGSIEGGPLPFPEANESDLLAGNTYFNIHSAVYPAGEIRGQLIPTSQSGQNPQPVPEPATLLLLAGGLLGIAVVAGRKST